MNYEILTRRLIQTSVSYQTPLPMSSVLPEYISFHDSLVLLTKEDGGPSYEELLDEIVAVFSEIVKVELEKEIK